MSESLPRVVSVVTRPCPSCGTGLAVVHNGDGSTSAMACETCYPATEKASASTVQPREVGTNVEADGE